MMDIAYIITWWAYLFVLGIISLPLTKTIFGKFTDIGYGFTKTIGILLSAYLVFLLATLKIFPFSIYLVYFSLSTFTFINVYFVYKNKKPLVKDIKKHIKVIFIQEIVFTLGLVLWSYVRSYQPDINGLEKFMDFGFINSILRSKYFPPGDMWFAGGAINYYWFGHFVTAFLTKLTRIPSSITYNLMLATILGLSLSAAFSISSTLIKLSKKNVSLKTAFAAGIISMVLLNFGGNFHTAFFFSRQYLCENYLTFPACKETRVTKDYWYPDATRFIGYDPDVEDKTIHEFPLYSYVVSDLHAHLINFPFVLLFIGLLISFTSQYKSQNWKTLRKMGKRVIPLGFLIGVFFMTNAWDTANYLLLTGITLVLFNLNEEFKTKRDLFAKFFNTFLKVLYLLVIIILTGMIVVLPFYLNFESIAQGLAFVNSTTPLWQLAVLWGFPAILTAIFISALALKSKKIGLVKTDLFVLSLLTTSWILVFIPEIIYVKDIYIASHHRANTMFKLTYQTFVMTYLSSGYIAIRVLYLIKSKTRKGLVFLVFASLFSIVLIYPKKAVDSYYGELKNYQGLKGDTWLEERYPDEYVVVSWFNNNVAGQPVILEAQGDSYTDYNVISSYTGLPTINGWYVHEWLWRGDASFPQGRSEEVRQIYTSTDISLTKSLLKKYNVKYVIIGTLERQKYTNINTTKFEALGGIVFRSGNTNVYKLN